MMTTYQLAPHIDLQPLDDSLMLLDLNGNAYYTLNETARFFIERITSGKSFDDIATEASELYDVEKAQLIADFTNLLDELQKLGWLIAKP